MSNPKTTNYGYTLQSALTVIQQVGLTGKSSVLLADKAEKLKYHKPKLNTKMKNKNNIYIYI